MEPDPEHKYASLVIQHSIIESKTTNSFAVILTLKKTLQILKPLMLEYQIGLWRRCLLKFVLKEIVRATTKSFSVAQDAGQFHA